ncbi:helix-turn-helix domain-containing protein [Maribacter sp. HTCC2170]|uniref:helix-turn-helix domain-containing protein n=1 Tax=Maribacter sp. (strain HTCC2170 / KCCM 42371) TaxID=313603 RepID=UPI00006BE0C2|nr:helix-turn-helix domain-containing protein [Maribacter sp. HTCC2170]EAQ99957.1 DNA binding protein [Maribacter sp. HTCC2170]
MRHIGILITFFLLCIKAYPAVPIEHKESFYNNKILPNFIFSTTSNLFEEDEVYGQSPILDNGITKISLGLNTFSLNVIEPTLFSNNTSAANISQSITNDYPPRINLSSFLYLYVALIGFYIAAVLQFNKKIDRIAKILISCFIFIHSIFILHICLNMTNYHYQYPHSFRMSTLFSFLYGPLLYFYFKRITQQYQFKKEDLLHLTPTLLLLFVLFPTYILPSDEKLTLMIERVSLGRSVTDLAIIVFKLLSLTIYGYFIRKVYLNSKSNKGLGKQNRLWQSNLYTIHFIYIGSYAAYGILLSNGITSGFLYHLQVILMALMVMYLGYSANVQPNVFSGIFTLSDKYFFKYEKSGLTNSLSQELKTLLLDLLNKEKIYRENNINLEKLANRLNTTRHNASQVINEHFDMNFHELINKYRIDEAKDIFNRDYQRNLNIIDVAYEVGYNNKVTFNKAFKKDTNLTPSEYQRVALKATTM